MNSIIIDEVLEFEDLNEEAKQIQDPEKAAEIIKTVRRCYLNKKERDYKCCIPSRTGTEKN